MTRWTEPAERGSTTLIRLIAWLARTVGRRVCRLLLYPIVAYFVVTDRRTRRASAEFLAAARGRPTPLADVFRHVYAFAATLLDRVYLAAGERHRFEITFVGRELAERIAASGRGCVLLGSHLGSFDLMICMQQAVSAGGLSVMMRIDPRARVRRIAGIDDAAFDAIPTGRPDSLLRAHRALGEGRMVAILADRVDGGAHRTASFLGAQVSLPLAPHVLAVRADVPVLMFFGLYEGGNRYRIELVDFGPIAAPGSRGGAMQPMLDRYAAVLEHYARAYPMNWFNFYPYWSQVGAGRRADTTGRATRLP